MAVFLTKKFRFRNEHIMNLPVKNLDMLTEFFGWCVVISFGIHFLGLLAILPVRQKWVRLHAKIFGLEESQVNEALLSYFARYKIAAILLTLVPYMALKIMIFASR